MESLISIQTKNEKAISDDFVKITNLTKKYGDFVAVDNLSLSIKKGEFFGLLGPNGAGKSTTIGVMSTYIEPTGGQVTINGLDVVKSAAKLREKIGIVPQEIALYEELSAKDNLDFFAEMYSISGKFRKERVAQVLHEVGLYERRDDAIKKFSGGMKRRINLAVGLLNDPLFLMLDEPTVGIDPQSRNHIFETIQKRKQNGTTILYTTHYMEEAEQLCDRIAIIDHGRLIACGTLDELLSLNQNRVVIEKPRGLGEVFLQLTGRELRDG
jgi:ABC-2 type transport system ATP-binding protein